VHRISGGAETIDAHSHVAASCRSRSTPSVSNGPQHEASLSQRHFHNRSSNSSTWDSARSRRQRFRRRVAPSHPRQHCSSHARADMRKPSTGAASAIGRPSADRVCAVATPSVANDPARGNGGMSQPVTCTSPASVWPRVNDNETPSRTSSSSCTSCTQEAKRVIRHIQVVEGQSG